MAVAGNSTGTTTGSSSSSSTSERDWGKYNYYKNMGYSEEQADRMSRVQSSSTAAKASGNNTPDITADDYNAISNRNSAVYNQVINYSNLYGYMVKPILNATGDIISFEPLLDASGNKLPTLQNIQNAAQRTLIEAQVQQATADVVLQHAKAYGKVKDPETGNWVPTTERMLADSTISLNAANAQRMAAQTQLEQQSQLSQALADPNRYVEAFGLAQLMGSRLGGTPNQPGGLWGYAQNSMGQQGQGQQGVPAFMQGQNAVQSQAQNQGVMAAQNVNAQSATNQGQNAQDTGIKIDYPKGDVNAQSSGNNATPAAIGSQASATGNASTTGTGQSNGTGAQAGSVTSPYTVNTQNLAALAGSTQLPVSANLNAALQNQWVPERGNTDFAQSTVTNLGNIQQANQNFAKINPVIYRNLDSTTQGQYNSLGKSIQGINAEDLKKQIGSQLPGSSGSVPAAFKMG
jgi:hypothetical protein